MIIVAGIARSGLTATIQMLNAGGYPCLGKYPAFEPFTLGNIQWDIAEGKAVKLVDAQLQFPPVGKKYKIIYLSRDRKQQAKSTNKFVGVLGIPPIKLKKLIRSFKIDYKIIDTWAKNHDVLRIKFEDLINRPMSTALKISGFTGGDLNTKKMCAAVIDRKPECGPELLELSMM